MGVSNLWTYLLDKRGILFNRVDLVEVAKSRPNGIHLIVDFYSWEHFMKTLFYKSVSLQIGHPYIIFDGGEYKLMDIFIKNFITALRNVRIELVFYLDGAKGSSAFATKQKWATWIKRFDTEQSRLLKVMDFLSGQIPMSAVETDRLPRPCLQEIQNLLTLQSLGCSLNQCVAGEADSFIAQHMLKDKDAFAVSSNDTDFCIFPGSVFLHNDRFDLDNDLGLGSASLNVRTPPRLNCDLICSDTLWKYFGFPGSGSLTELSIICGNDFTSPFLKNFMPKTRRWRIPMDELIDMIKKFGRAEKCPYFRPLIVETPGMQDAVRHSRKFYAMELGEEISDDPSNSFEIIVSKVRQCIFPSSVIAMWKSFYWHRQIMEEPSKNHMSAEEALMPLRAYVYSILLPPDKHVVKEYGRLQHSHFSEVLVRKVQDQEIPTLPVAYQNPIAKNLQIFEYILSHQESVMVNEGRSFFKQFGVQRGFICYLLRYFLILNWQKNMCIRPREFLTLCAWLLGDHSEETHYLQMKIVPSTRCITLESWFQLLFRLSYAFLGHVLNLSHSFPTPAELFSGATWVSLYTSVAVTDPNPETAEPHPLSVSFEELFRTSNHVFEIVDQERQIISCLVKNVFHLQP